MSERRACAALGQHRSTQRKVPRGREDAERLTSDIIELARQYGRYGYRKIAALLLRIERQRVGQPPNPLKIWARASLKLESNFRVASTPFHKSTLCELQCERAPIIAIDGYLVISNAKPLCGKLKIRRAPERAGDQFIRAQVGFHRTSSAPYVAAIGI